MNWITIETETTENLINKLTAYDSGWLFRGQASADWDLQPTLERILSPIGWDPEMAQKCEEYSLHLFSSKAHHYIAWDKLPTTKLGWLSLMQHHGVPTRLLDFTESPFIALFFSFNETSISEMQPSAVWALNYRNITKSSIEYLKDRDNHFEYDYSSAQMQPDEFFDKYLDSGSNDILWAAEPRISNIRMERQKGTFLMSGNIHKRIIDLIPSVLPAQEVHKILIQPSMVNEIFKILKSMGIDNSRLFSNLDGLSKDLKTEMKYQVTSRLLPSKI